jgi:hypothetical protein
VNEPAPAKAVLVPPRPNLGPEPLPRRLDVLELTLIVGAAATGLVGLILASRRVRRDHRREAEPGRPRLPEGPFATRREQMAGWSKAVREALSRRHGEHWRARTTEEIAADPALAGSLGPEAAARLVAFLVESDRAKFDDREGLQSPLAGDGTGPGLDLDWLGEFVAAAVPAAGARSRTTGK